jgi:hypothetical protein
LRIRNNRLKNDELENNKKTDEYKNYINFYKYLKIKPYSINGSTSSLEKYLIDLNVNKINKIIKFRELQSEDPWAFRKWLK